MVQLFNIKTLFQITAGHFLQLALYPLGRPEGGGQDFRRCRLHRRRVQGPGLQDQRVRVLRDI